MNVYLSPMNETNDLIGARAEQELYLCSLSNYILIYVSIVAKHLSMWAYTSKMRNKTQNLTVFSFLSINT